MVKKESTKTIPDGYVKIDPLFYDGEKYKNPVSVIINGKKYSVPRGKEVVVPIAVADVLEQSRIQDAYAAKVNTEAQKTKTIEM